MNLDPANQLSLYGHHSEFCNFINLYKNKKLPNKILLSGEKGIGKSTLAYHIINRILSFDEDHPYDEKNFQINHENKSYKLILNKCRISIPIKYKTGIKKFNFNIRKSPNILGNDSHFYVCNEDFSNTPYWINGTIDIVNEITKYI